MLSQGDDTGDMNVVDWVAQYLKITYNKPGNAYVGLIHRLDRPAGGVLLLAKTSKAAGRLSRQFQERKVRKMYHVITERSPEPPNGDLNHYLRKLPDKNIMRAYRKKITHSQAASLSYRVLQQHESRTLVEVVLHTGRKHQIRVQLGSIGCPVVGDVKYGKTEFQPDMAICLLSRELVFRHPITRDPVRLLASYPETEAWMPFIRQY